MSILSKIGVDSSLLDSLDREALRELASQPKTWLLGAAIGVTTFVTFSVVKSFWNRRYYPPGPCPYPFIGNLPIFSQMGQFHETMIKLKETHGNVITLWLSQKPVVVLCDHAAGLEAFRDRKNDFMGRPQDSTTRIFLGDEGSDVISADFGREWEVLRRVAHSAARKFAVNDQLPRLVAEVVDDAIKVIKAKHGDKEFDFNEYSYLIVYNILAQSAYGTRYSINDPEFVKLKDDDLERTQMGSKLLWTFMIPFLRHFSPTYKRFVKIATEYREFLISKYREHVATFDEGDIRDFCDALISAKKEAELEDKNSLKYLTDINLSLTLMNLFSAGTLTTKMTLQAIFLFLANFPDVQTRLREEIEQIAGDEIVTLDDKDQLNYCRAFISEAMRFKPAAALGVGHKTIVDSTVGGHRILKGTTVLFVQYAALHDPKFWHKPEEFNPDRFLDARGKFKARVDGNVPFGIGRRLCLGEKLALTDLLFITCRILQATKGFKITLPDGPGSADLGAGKPGTIIKPHKFILKRTD